jgi:peptidoglycan/LPS O-acetylase OafA/YrhL
MAQGLKSPFPKRLHGRKSFMQALEVKEPTLPLARRNLVALDGVRGLAIIAVMCCHSVSASLHPVTRHVFSLGWSGVDLFFVLSGFLITGILLDTREAANYYKSFYSRRFLRIFPLYYSFLLIALIVFPHIVRPDWMPLRADWWLYACYLMNLQILWHEPWHANILGHFWSLCVEEQFYFVWPVIVLAMRPLSLLRFVVATELAMLCGRSWWVWSHGSSVVLSTLTVTRMDGLLLGAACAVVVREFHLPRRVARVLPWIAAFLLATFVAGYQAVGPRLRESFVESVGLLLLVTAFSAILLAAVLTDSQRVWVQSWLRWKPLTRFGKYSYGIYIFHVPIFYSADRLLERLSVIPQESYWFGYSFLLVKVAISFCVASFSYNFFEKRFLLLKARFEPQYNLSERITAGASSESA